MTRTAPPADRPTPMFRECDGAPWPRDDELDLDAEWAAFREQGDRDWWPDAEPPSRERVRCSEAGEHEAMFAPDPLSAATSDGATAAAGDIDARLGRLEGSPQTAIGPPPRSTA